MRTQVYAVPLTSSALLLIASIVDLHDGLIDEVKLHGLTEYQVTLTGNDHVHSGVLAHFPWLGSPTMVADQEAKAEPDYYTVANRHLLGVGEVRVQHRDGRVGSVTHSPEPSKYQQSGWKVWVFWDKSDWPYPAYANLTDLRPL